MFKSLRELAEAYAPSGSRVRRLVAHCTDLMTERGEAAGVSLARVALDLYRELDKDEQAKFFAVLRAEFSPNPSDVLAASQAYAADASAANLSRVCVAAEPPLSVTCPPRSARTPAAESPWVVIEERPPRVIVDGVVDGDGAVPVA